MAGSSSSCGTSTGSSTDITDGEAHQLMKQSDEDHVFSFQPELRTRVYDYVYQYKCNSASGISNGSEAETMPEVFISFSMQQRYLDIEGTGGAVYPCSDIFCQMLCEKGSFKDSPEAQFSGANASASCNSGVDIDGGLRLEVLRPQTRALEMGCGPGLLALFCAQFSEVQSYWAVDVLDVSELCKLNVAANSGNTGYGGSVSSSKIVIDTMLFGRDSTKEFLQKANVNFNTVLLSDCCYDDGFHDIMLESIDEVRKASVSTVIEHGKSGLNFRVVVCYPVRNAALEQRFVDKLMAADFRSVLDFKRRVMVRYDAAMEPKPTKLHLLILENRMSRTTQPDDY